FEPFSRTSVEDRLALIERVIAEYQKRMDDMAQAISAEMGAPLSLAKTAQVGSGIGHLMSAARALKDFAFEEQVGNSLVVHEPIGVVAMITPWNW
ncbi:MAG: aldehyde dehydrogenase family protein, partial [Hyphomonas sp.]